MKRVVTGVVTAALVAVIVLFLAHGLFALTVALAMVIAASEYGRLAGKIASCRSIRLPLGAAVAVLALTDAATSGLIDPGFLATVCTADMWYAATAILFAMAIAIGFGGRASVRDRLLAPALFVFGVVWLGLFLIAAVRLHAIEPVLLLWMLAVVSMGDVAAYYGGRRFGRRPLSPVLSPNKTIEGALAGFFGSAVAGVAVVLVWRGPESLGPGVAVLVLLCGAAGVAGDLLASLLKRAAGARDTGKLLPGHGGLLDRLDSALLAGPVLHLAVQAGAAGSLLGPVLQQ